MFEKVFFWNGMRMMVDGAVSLLCSLCCLFLFIEKIVLGFDNQILSRVEEKKNIIDH